MSTIVNITYVEALWCFISSMIIFFPGIIFALISILALFKPKNEQTITNKFTVITTLFAIFFSILCCLFVSIYFVWILLYPIENELKYMNHGSQNARIIGIISTYLSKLFLFMIFNGRLYFTFRYNKNPDLKSKKNIFFIFNIFIGIYTIVSIIVGFIGSFIYNIAIITTFGFTFYHIIFIILLLYLSHEFNLRVKIIIKSFVQKRTKISRDFSINTDTHSRIERLSSTISNETQVTPIPNTVNNISQDKMYLKYMKLLIRSNVLLFWIIISSLLITIFSFISTHMVHSHIAVSISLLVISLDCSINILCLLLLFKFADKYYNIICKCKCFNNKIKCISLDHYCKICITNSVIKFVNAKIISEAKNLPTMDQETHTTTSEAVIIGRTDTV